MSLLRQPLPEIVAEPPANAWSLVRPSVSWPAPLVIASTPPDRAPVFWNRLQTAGFGADRSEIAGCPVLPPPRPTTP